MKTTKELLRRLPKARHMPEFASEGEEREWWASHDTSELPGQDVALVRRGTTTAHKRTRLAIDLIGDTVERLKALAAEEGISTEALAQRWIVERLTQETQARRP